MAHAFSPSRARSLVFATFAVGAPVGGAFSMIVGSVLTQLIVCVTRALINSTTFLMSSCRQTWCSVFYLAAGTSALIFFSGLVSFDADTPSTIKHVGWIGVFLVTIGLVLIVFVLGQGEIAPQDWKTPCESHPCVLYSLCLVVGGYHCSSYHRRYHGHAIRALERYLEQVRDDPSRSLSLWTPPLMRPSIWARAKGHMAIILAIAFLNWGAFISWSFWVQVCAVGIRLSATIDRATIIAILPEPSATHP